MACESLEDKSVGMKTILVMLVLLLVSMFCQLADVTSVLEISTTIRVPDDYETIQGAIDAANPGDTIQVASGTYYESVTIHKDRLTLIGENTNTTVIDGNRTGTVVYLTGDNVTISGFTVQNSSLDWKTGPYAGIHLHESNNSVISDNLVRNCWTGIYLDDSNDNTINKNTVEKCDSGIVLGYSSHNTLEHNSVDNNSRGIALIISSFNVLTSNSMTNNKFNFGVFGTAGSPLSNFIQEIDVSNTVDGKPIYYLTNQTNLDIGPSTFPDIGYLALINSNNITVKDLTFTNNGQGVLFAYTTNSVIENVTASNNSGGIILTYSHRNNVSNCLISNNYNGLIIFFSNHNTIIQNTVSNSELTGIGISGFLLDPSHDNIIIQNMIYNNTIGLSSVDSSKNRIYHNNFVNNTVQAEEFDYFNDWWDDYPSGGNYWSDYIGVDEFSGQFQNETGGDGIGDEPHTPEGSTVRDLYPLLYPWSTHDVAIPDVIPSMSEVYAGWIANVSVNVRNNGGSSEAFDVTLSYDENVIGMKPLTLNSGTITTQIFVWNTTDVPYNVSYTLRAEASSVPGEANLENNVHVYGVIKIKMKGDANGDGEVDYQDLFQLATAYGSRTGEPKYNLQCDFNQDSKIDYKDLFALAVNYGKTY